MNDLLNELFNPKVGGKYSCMIISLLIILSILVILAYNLAIDQDIKMNNERDLIEVMECNKLGDMILKQEISYRNEDFALDHWVIRCK